MSTKIGSRPYETMCGAHLYPSALWTSMATLPHCSAPWEEAAVLNIDTRKGFSYEVSCVAAVPHGAAVQVRVCGGLGGHI